LHEKGNGNGTRIEAKVLLSYSIKEETMNKDDKKDEENNRSDQEHLTESFLQKLKTTTNVPMVHMNLYDHERCAVRFISAMLTRGNYQWSEDAFLEAIRLYPQYCRSMH
jgi:hypothetical protein